MLYELRLATTTSGIGYFTCHPVADTSFDESLEYLRRCPNDDFMHNYLVDKLGRLDEATTERILELARNRDPVVTALIYEAALSFPQLHPLCSRFSESEIISLLEYSPKIDIKWSLLEDRDLHYQWTRIFEANLSRHQPLPPLSATGLKIPYEEDVLLAASGKEVHVRELYKKDACKGSGTKTMLPSASETAVRALKSLEMVHAIAMDEVKHTSSLSPFGFLRKWRIQLDVRNGRHDYALSGTQTSYGKGLTEDSARASYAMEMVERYSSFASFGPEGILGYVNGYPLLHSRYSELQARGANALDPNSLTLEVPYNDEPLYWMEAEERYAADRVQILIPTQCVFLFCNLDEISLFSGLGSTGLASGNSLEQAKVSALLEVIERDAEGTTPYDSLRCFRVDAQDPGVASLLAAYESVGIHVQYQDLSREFGIPCYKGFVIGPHGQVVKGTGAHLNGRKALLSALTEVPYPYPDGPPSAPRPEGLPLLHFEDLPDFSTGDPVSDLRILEATLTANGYRTIYVDLTRKDLDIPVVRAIVPGMELMADFDRFSKLNPRLFRNYLKMDHRLSPRNS